MIALIGVASAPAQTGGSASRLVDLNRGIRAYIDADYATARELLEGVLADEPDHAACLYYLGLIYMDEGLTASASGTPEGRNSAREWFDRARANFERITQLGDPQLADPSATTVEAALLLGIAQLANTDPALKEVELEAQTKAKETLQGYTQTDVGKNDRYGFFYLGVAHYRLGDHYKKAKKTSESRDHFTSALAAFDRAVSCAEVDLKRGGMESHSPRALDQEQFDRFALYVEYYRGLVAVFSDDSATARVKLQYVADHSPGRLGNHAKSILEEMDRVAAEQRKPATVPTPFGEIDFEAELSIGASYDTNVILLGKDTILPLNLGKKNDFTFDASARIDVGRYFDEAEIAFGKSLSLGLGGETNHAFHPSIDQFDLNIYGGRLYANWQPIQDLYLGLEYYYSYTLLGRSPFISSNRFTAVLSKVWADESDKQRREVARTDFWYNLDLRNYLETVADWRFNRDGVYNAVGIQQQFYLVQASDMWAGYYASRAEEEKLFGREWLTLKVGYVHRDERTDGTEFDLRGMSVLAGIEVPLPYRLNFGLESAFTWEDYSARSAFDYRGNTRYDFAQQYDLGLTRTFVARGENKSLPTLEVKLRANVALRFQDSNIWDRLGEDVYEYDRAIYGLRLDISF